MENDLKNCIENCIVVLTAGGEGSRFKGVAGSEGIQKAAYKLPTGETMIERTIKMYKELGLTNFVILTYHNAESIEKALGDGAALGVSIRYSRDPGSPVGRGGAVKNAFVNGSLTSNSYLIVHNPDDQIVAQDGASHGIVRTALAAHLEHEKRGAIATAIMADGTPYEFTGFTINDGFVTEVEMYPFIKMPTHIGMTIFSPAAAHYFDKLFDLAKKNDFEAVLFPVLKEEKKLAAHIIPANTWISVNDEKGLKKLIKCL